MSDVTDVAEVAKAPGFFVPSSDFYPYPVPHALFSYFSSL